MAKIHTENCKVQVASLAAALPSMEVHKDCAEQTWRAELEVSGKCQKGQVVHMNQKKPPLNPPLRMHQRSD